MGQSVYSPLRTVILKRKTHMDGHMKIGSPRRRRGGGSFVVIVGPDGVGKTTVARKLIERFEGPTGYFHFRPPLHGPLQSAPPQHSAAPPGKGEPGGSVLLGWLRLLRNTARFWAGYVATVSPAVRRGALVVADRWAYGYVAQPLALRFFGPEALARLAVRLLPQPDLIVNLTAPPAVIRARKQELSEEAITLELDRWRRIPSRRRRDMDAIGDPEAIASLVLEELK